MSVAAAFLRSETPLVVATASIAGIDFVEVFCGSFEGECQYRHEILLESWVVTVQPPYGANAQIAGYSEICRVTEFLGPERECEQSAEVERQPGPDDIVTKDSIPHCVRTLPRRRLHLALHELSPCDRFGLPDHQADGRASNLDAKLDAHFETTRRQSLSCSCCHSLIPASPRRHRLCQWRPSSLGKRNRETRPACGSGRGR